MGGFYKVLNNILIKVKKSKFLGLISYSHRFFLSNDIPTFPRQVGIEEFKDCQNILVLSPHQDDETFGMGGLLYALKKNGKDVDIVWFSHADNNQRVNEAKNLMHFLAIEFSFEKSFPIEGDILAESQAFQRISQLLENKMYDMICIPSFLETHHDHVTLYRTFRKALEKNKQHSRFILQYEVWSTLVPNVIFDISNIISEKRKMMQFFKSQLDLQRDYEGKILGLNKYRGLAYSLKYAEAYIYLSVDEFMQFSHD